VHRAKMVEKCVFQPDSERPFRETFWVYDLKNLPKYQTFTVVGVTGNPVYFKNEFPIRFSETYLHRLWAFSFRKNNWKILSRGHSDFLSTDTEYLYTLFETIIRLLTGLPRITPPEKYNQHLYYTAQGFLENVLREICVGDEDSRNLGGRTKVDRYDSDEETYVLYDDEDPDATGAVEVARVRALPPPTYLYDRPFPKKWVTGEAEFLEVLNEHGGTFTQIWKNVFKKDPEGKVVGFYKVEKKK